jgi:hypothetical protein
VSTRADKAADELRRRAAEYTEAERENADADADGCSQLRQMCGAVERDAEVALRRAAFAYVRACFKSSTGWNDAIKCRALEALDTVEREAVR